MPFGRFCDLVSVPAIAAPSLLDLSSSPISFLTFAEDDGDETGEKPTISLLWSTFLGG